MVVETIHVMEANETTSEAFKNYAGAAFLVGMAVISIGIGLGIISNSIKNLRTSKESASSFANDLVDELRERVRKNEPVGTPQKAAEEVVSNLRRTMEDILTGHSQVLDQVKSDTDTFYWVSNSYKEPITQGSMIPENFLTKKPPSMNMETFLKKHQVKFKSRTSIRMKGGIPLVEVGEILNSTPVKPV